MQTDTYLCQIRLKSFTPVEDDWRTMQLGSLKGADAWRKQVAPRKRRQGYSTRVVRAD